MVAETKKLKAVVVGLGSIGFSLDLDPLRPRIWSHSKAYQVHPQFELVGACDISQSARDLFKRHYPEIPVSNDYISMVRALEPDIISLCVRETELPQIFHEIVNADCGVKLFFVEKPVARNSSQIRRMERVAKDKNLVLLVNYFRRFSRGFAIVDEIVRKQSLGRLRKINALGCTALKTSSSHLIDLCLYFGGDPTTVFAFKQLDYERVVDCHSDPGGEIWISTERGVYVNLSCSTNSEKKYVFEMDLVFDDGRVAWSDIGFGCVKLYRYQDGPENYAGNGYFPLQELDTFGPGVEVGWEPMLTALSFFADHESNKLDSVCSLTNAMKVVELIEKVESVWD